MLCLLLVAAGAAWESEAVRVLDRRTDMMVLKRCVDIEDALATATAGQAHGVVTALDAPGLDGSAVDHLARCGLRTVAVAAGSLDDGARQRAARVGVDRIISDDALATLPEVLLDIVTVRSEPAGPPEQLEDTGAATTGGVVAVWGPAGAPGRTTLACGLAALRAPVHPVTLIDADPQGGSVRQQLGVLDEVSGILAAARCTGASEIDQQWPSLLRRLSPGLDLLTGLPRADRWPEVRAGVVERLLGVARGRGDVVVDTGFDLAADPGPEFGSRPTRNTMTLEAVGAADQLVVVGLPDPVGLARLARGLVQVGELRPDLRPTVVVNRNRSKPGLVGAGGLRHGARHGAGGGGALPARRPGHPRPGPGRRPHPGRGRGGTPAAGRRGGRGDGVADRFGGRRQAEKRR